ncbi:MULTISPECIES: LysR family transcriptional regulator [Streptomyces]|uniref:LysR family transcriptional regulator n=1 Tax=Streptomyces tsukubensis (strain DSM 42081 / NBRC 108919 / NRRL 18488 / 9993) TaxID=1114943 RepID=I2N1Z9_STRT9|nr:MULTISPECIES: LysR family transcriptional regulator [Streptomyces]AZK95169.1 LysR family transcriptional regulator [Streptomyces tsukubensis]EIF91046.1 LysR family transcriptional regulator [Streptomyces tsukubensis NRRL18488]MYS65938.1 LysR family transcriptional regulator [Streptomyces sp. SID5473]QKM68770.1 LysR family transcriptional regulator [Streptomyces tsukubensis NRRL18488]TAI43575.1 LysR family transcriptional regulator [Streptomyces tsukubensis]
MDLALLRTFVTVHRAGSFTRAAALLGLSQPAVTGQIRTLERQLGKPLFLRQARGVTPTSVGDELAHRAAPHLDALVEIAESGLDEEAGVRTLHLAGPPEFTSLRALPALTPLLSQGLALRAAFGKAEESLEGLAAGHHDLAITTARPRGGLLTATPLCDEEHVLVASPRWAARLGPDVLRAGQVVLEQLPVVEVHESLPLVSRYWATVFESPPAAAGTVIAPDLRAVLESTAAGAGLAVLPRYLCEEALDRGRVVTLLEPPVPPLRTYFLVVRAGTLALPHISRAHDWLMRAAADW